MQVQEANFDFWWMSIQESCVGNMMNNFTSPYTLRPTLTQMALRPFVIVFKWLYCPSRDLIGCQNISASVGLKGNTCKQRIQLDSNSLIIARKIALLG